MISADGEFVVCDGPGCEQKLKNHKWGKVKSEGWFFSKDGKAYCPAHIPEWVEAWRARKLR